MKSEQLFQGSLDKVLDVTAVLGYIIHMLVNLSKKRVEDFVVWGNAYIEKLEGMKGPFKNNDLYDKEIARTIETRDIIMNRLQQESERFVDDIKI